jgi:hypothetical protein
MNNFVTDSNVLFHLVIDKDTGRINSRSRGNSGSIVSDYGLDDRGSILDRGRGFFF